ncbi:MAG: DUF6338 family protein [Dermatophilaceae bacterium]
MIPSTPAQLLITLVLVLPGFVYQETRIRLRGRAPGEQELTSRLLRAIAWSLGFALGYALLMGPQLGEAIRDPPTLLADPRRAAVLGLLLGLGVPALVATLPSLIPEGWEWPHRLQALRPSQLTRYDSTPSAWDRAFKDAGPCFVRVRMKDGTWFAGYYGRLSYASSFPDSRSLFLEASFKVGDDGLICDPVTGTVGAVIDCSEATLVEFLLPAPESTEDQGVNVDPAEALSEQEVN